MQSWWAEEKMFSKFYNDNANYYYNYLLTMNYDFCLNKLLIFCSLIIGEVLVKFQ